MSGVKGGAIASLIEAKGLVRIAQAQSHMMSNQYEGLMRKANLK